jgi:hypothetical protein
MNSNLNLKQWIMATVASFVVMAVLNYIVHAVLLTGWYQEYPNYWRTQADMMSRMHWMYVGYLLFSALFSYIYTKGYEGKQGLGEGMRYGALIGAIVGFPKMFADHVMFPYQGKVILAWGIATFVICVVMGIVTGMIYKGQPKAA